MAVSERRRSRNGVTRSSSESPSDHSSEKEAQDEATRQRSTTQGADIVEEIQITSEDQETTTKTTPPPLPDEDIPPPLPDEQPPDDHGDDGWDPVWDATAQAFYFHNRITQQTQWENPRIPQTTVIQSGLGSHDRSTGDDEQQQQEQNKKIKTRGGGGYNPAIHGDYDPNADYAQVYEDSDDELPGNVAAVAAQNAGAYETAGAFNRFTGRWQASDINPDNHNDDNKSKRQMSAFFDVDAAANSHDGKSLKAERQSKKFSKKEIKAFREKRRDRKEEKRRAWLRD